VVNRLRQVTSAIRQDGANRVSVITSSAQRRAAVEFAKAQAMRPKIVGEALQEITADPEVSEALFKILEMENMLKGETKITLLPVDQALIKKLVGAETAVETMYEGNGQG
jgi:hypothetical protein